MQRSDFYFDLPPELIAQTPTEQRNASRLLAVLAGELKDLYFSDLPSLLEPGDLLVFNDTKVIPARLYGNKASGGKVELLIERLLSEQHALAQIRSSRSPKAGSWLRLEGGIDVKVVGRSTDLFELEFVADCPVLDILEQYGHIPLPPYIQRSVQKYDDALDCERYQTVYAKRPGAVAAPTAGLHFDQTMLNLLSAHGIELAFITLHVGAGTFQPVRSNRLDQHHMHHEWINVDASVCEKIQQTRNNGGRVIAVGTTVVRSLESASRGGELKPFKGDTNIFIYPGFEYRCVDALITNFHLPESTLLMLVSAFSGYAEIMHAYQHAISKRYRFFSYGDAMFLTRKNA